MANPFIDELAREADTTRRVLERVPADKLSWKPHPKSMSLGQLALHVAQTPGQVATLITENQSEIPQFVQAEAKSTGELMTALDQSVATASSKLSGWTDAGMMTEWTLRRGTQTLMALPRVGMVRSIMLNHWYHHRGQLVVYLRLLNVPVPSVYGPSADENPFA
ncbi:MAG: DinB family protein [Vicinamibacterales bacterium]|nr:DinB family protein [Vicinamibacterales bacterium]